MTRGRKPKSVAQKILEGNPGKRPLNVEPSLGGKGELRKPLGLTDGAGRLWDEWVPTLSAGGLFDLGDALLLAQFFEAMNLANMAALQIEACGENGLMLDYVNNYGERVFKKNPLVSQWNTAVQRMEKLGSMFGLSPSDRARLVSGSSQQVGFADLDIGEPITPLRVVNGDE